ncbi:MAG: UpxY family transcription antiterminator [Fimbriimonadaceae bacterium]|nr:UpxY family transcription antiterminator [Chitinophagales bacterium]
MGKILWKNKIAPVYPEMVRWYVLYVRSRSEKKVKERLEKNKIEVFLPLIKVVRQWSDRKKQVQVPLFNGYIFLKINPEKFTTVKMIEGVVGFVKQEKKYATIKEEELNTIKIFLDTGIHVEAQTDNFEKGEKVKITFGPLKDVEGELIEIQNEKHFIVRIEIINQVLKVSVPIQYLKKI